MNRKYDLSYENDTLYIIFPVPEDGIDTIPDEGMDYICEWISQINND